ncbi:MAG: methyltransferase domain-containing protein [Ktedonobacteraceae bacterium]
MDKEVQLDSDHQTQVNAYFHVQSSFWKDIYTQDNVYAEIHQQRYARVLAWIEQLDLARDTQALDIGCGAGFLTLALAERGFRVQAIDSVEAMIEQTHQHASEAGLAEHISVGIGTITSLAFADASFDLVLAIGVIPWIGQGQGPAQLAIQEMKRITKPGGYILFTADNRLRFASWFDPLLSPPLLDFKIWLKAQLERVGMRQRSVENMGSYLHSPRFIDKTLAAFALMKVKSTTLGFGPFTFFHCPLLTKKAGIAFHRRLQRLAERGVPVLRGTGMQYIVLAQKPAVSSFNPSADTQKAVSDPILTL